MTGPATQHATVLIVDDDEPIRSSLRTLLEDANYDVLEAADGLAALDLLHADARRLVVLLDYRMPYLDGLGLLREIACDRQLAPRHAYVLMTADPIAARREFQGILAAMHIPLLTKPFDLDRVLDEVARAALKRR